MYHRPLKAILAALMVIGLLAVIGVLILGAVVGRAHHPSDEWWQGYMTGRLESDEGEGRVPLAFYGRRHSGLAPLACGAGLLLLGLPLLLLVVGGLFIRRQAWRAAGGPFGPSKAWRWHGPSGSRREPSEEEVARMKAWHKAHGPLPSWCRGWEEPAEEQPEKPADDEPR